MGKRTQTPSEDENPLEGLQDYLEAHQKDSIFSREAGKGSSWCLFLHGQQRKKGSVQSDRTYEIDLKTPQGEVEQIHKVNVKMLCEASREEEVLGLSKTNEALKAALTKFRKLD